MSRFILIIELILGAVTAAALLEGINPLLFISLVPLVLIAAVPFFASLSIWPIGIVFRAYRIAFNQIPDRKDNLSVIILFQEQLTYISGFLGFLFSVVYILNRINTISFSFVINLIRLSGTMLIYALIIGLIFRLLLLMTKRIKLWKKLKFELEASFLRKYQITSRETEVMRMIFQGKENKEISQNLSVTDSTVKNHIYNIFQKTGVNNRTELIHKILSESKFLLENNDMGKISH
jgi:DNA-binding CsgD family transcriptional regulator